MSRVTSCDYLCYDLLIDKVCYYIFTRLDLWLLARKLLPFATIVRLAIFWSLVISWWNNNCQFMGIVSLRAWGMTIKQFPLFKAHFFGGKCPLLSLNLADILQRWLVGRSVGQQLEPFLDQTKQALCQRDAFYNESYSSQSSWFMVSEYYRITL